jgi:hypothetical protein
VLDDLLFSAILDNAVSRPVEYVLEKIRDLKLHYPGLVVFPVHSFGVLGAGLLNAITDVRMSYIVKSFGVAIAPQTNSIEKTIQFLDETSKAFGIRKRVPKESILHWNRSRPSKWLERNPVLVVRVRNFPGSYYANQYFLITELQRTTAILSMLSCLQPAPEQRINTFTSTSGLNNRQTLDFKHYIVLFNNPRSHVELKGDCVPMNYSGAELAEISNLGLELRPSFWLRKHPTVRRIFESVDTVRRGYINSQIDGSDKMRARVYKKMFNSLLYFRRSFLQGNSEWQSVVSLAIAFEMLLTDSYSGGVAKRIHKRATNMLRWVSGSRDLKKAVKLLYEERGSIVHTGFMRDRRGAMPGQPLGRTNVHAARRAFVHVFINMTRRLTLLREGITEPMAFLSMDIYN